MAKDVEPRKEEVQTNVPLAWRDTLRAVVGSIARCDTRIGEGIANVEPMSEDISIQCHKIVADYGSGALTRLPDETWSTSVAMWQGEYWQCLVDLWTTDEGRSDLVLDVDVLEAPDAGYRYRPHLVYTP